MPPAWEARLASWNRIARSGRRTELVLSREIPAAAVLGGRAPHRGARATSVRPAHRRRDRSHRRPRVGARAAARRIWRTPVSRWYTPWLDGTRVSCCSARAASRTGGRLRRRGHRRDWIAEGLCGVPGAPGDAAAAVVGGRRAGITVDARTAESRVCCHRRVSPRRHRGRSRRWGEWRSASCPPPSGRCVSSGRCCRRPGVPEMQVSDASSVSGVMPGLAETAGAVEPPAPGPFESDGQTLAEDRRADTPLRTGTTAATVTPAGAVRCAARRRAGLDGPSHTRTRHGRQ